MRKGNAGNAKSVARVAGLSLFVRLGAVAALSVFAATGCSFWGAAGSGPVDKDTAYRLYGRAPWKLSELDRQGLQTTYQGVPWDYVVKESVGVGANQAIIRQTSQRSWGAVPVLGYSVGQNFVVIDRPDKKSERLLGRSGFFLPLFPVAILWCHVWDTWYSLDRGEELATRLCYGLGPAGSILGYTRTVQPADIPQVDGSLLNTGPGTFGRYLAAVANTRGDDATYNSQWGWAIAGGLFAWGRVNYQYYFQVAWLPISLWRIRE
jgi:hypothetical protein